MCTVGKGLFLRQPNLAKSRQTLGRRYCRESSFWRRTPAAWEAHRSDRHVQPVFYTHQASRKSAVRPTARGVPPPPDARACAHTMEFLHPRMIRGMLKPCLKLKNAIGKFLRFCVLDGKTGYPAIRRRLLLGRYPLLRYLPKGERGLLVVRQRTSVHHAPSPIELTRLTLTPDLPAATYHILRHDRTPLSMTLPAWCPVSGVCARVCVLTCRGLSDSTQRLSIILAIRSRNIGVDEDGAARF
jgi:hypothetical protein